VSLDAGDSWRLAEEGLDRRFLWALAVDTADPELWYVSAAYHPREAHGGNGSANAAIYRKRGDGPWHAPASSEGMAEMPFALLALREHPGALIAGCDSGRLSPERGRRRVVGRPRRDALRTSTTFERRRADRSRAHTWPYSPSPSERKALCDKQCRRHQVT